MLRADLRILAHSIIDIHTSITLSTGPLGTAARPDDPGAWSPPRSHHATAAVRADPVFGGTTEIMKEITGRGLRPEALARTPA